MASAHSDRSSTGMMGNGALGMVGWAQKFYFMSQLPLRSLPEHFHQLGSLFSWSAGNIGCVRWPTYVSIGTPLIGDVRVVSLPVI